MASGWASKNTTLSKASLMSVNSFSNQKTFPCITNQQIFQISKYHRSANITNQQIILLEANSGPGEWAKEWNRDDGGGSGATSSAL